MAPARVPHRHPLARRIGRGLLAGAVLVLALAALAAAAGYGWLSSPAGEGWLRGKILHGLNAKIPGRLSIERLRIHGLRYDAEGVRLTTPSGEVVGRATALADLDLLALARGRIQLSDARASGLVLAVDLAPGGVPLLQALIPPSAHGGGSGDGAGVRSTRKPAGDPGDTRGAGGGGGGSSGFGLRRLRLTGARFVARQARAPALARTFVIGPVDGVLLHGEGWELSIAGRIAAPLAGAFRATVSTVSAGGVRTWTADLGAPGLSLAARLELEGPRRSARLERLSVDPGAARAIWPADPIPVQLSGSAVLASSGGGAWSVEASAASGPVQLHAAGTLSPAGVDPRLAATLPGASAEGALALSGGRSRGALTVRAPDLGAAARALSAATGVPLPLAGAGVIQIAFGAPAPGAAPALRVSGRFPTLAAGPASVSNVRLTGAASTAAGAPGAARLDVSAREAALSGRAAGPVAVELAAGSGRLAVAVDVRGRRLLRARGRLGPPGPGPRTAVLDALSLPGWRLVGPARVTGGAGALSVAGLVLRGAGGRVSLEGALSGASVHATVRLAGVRLAALPAALPLPRLAGVAGGAIALSGAVADPAISARLTVRGGPVPGLRAARIEVARAPGGALRARAAADGPGVEAEAWGDASDRILRAPGATPFRAALRARGAAAALARLAAAAGDAPLARRVAAARLRGRIWIGARAGGTAAAPAVQADVAARGLSARGSPPADARALLTRRGGATVARLALHTRRGGRLSLDAAVEPAGPAPGGRPARLRARLSARALDAGALAPWIPGVLAAGGRIDANAWASGPPFAPRAGGSLSWRGGRVVTEGYGRLDHVALLAHAGPQGWAIDRLEARSGGGRLLASARSARAGLATRVEGRARLASFPVVWGSRLLARASGRVSVRGTVGASTRLVAEVAGAELVLPPRLGGAVAPLRRPADVHLVTEVPPIASWPPPAPPPPAPAPPSPRSAPARPGVTVSLVTPEPVRVRGDGVDARVVAEPGLRLVRDGRWLVFGALRIPSGSVELLGERVALLDRSELRFAGPPDLPFIAVGARGTAGGGTETLVFRGPPGALQVGVAPAGTSVPSAFAALAGAAATSPGLHPPSPGSAPLALLDAQAPLSVLLGRGGTATSFAAGTPLTGRIRIEAAERIAADRWAGESRHVLRLDLALQGALDASVVSGDAGSLGVGLSWTTTRP